MKINIIAACDKDSIIGVNGKIPWRIPEDLKRFKEMTLGHAVICGRKTWNSLPFKPLPDRLNIIITGNKSYPITDNPLYASSLNHALSNVSVRNYEQAFIIGGEQLYREALPLADCVYLTLVNQETPIADGDEVARFPLDEFNKMFDDNVFKCEDYDVYSEYRFMDCVRNANTDISR